MSKRPNEIKPSSPVQVRDDGAIRIVTLADGKMNTLHRAMRIGIFDAIASAQDTLGVEAVLLMAAGPAWCAGADLNEMEGADSEADPNLHEAIFGLIHCMTKPVIAVIEGAALGGGFEFALGCHYRLATAGARLGLPEVSLGLIPGAGGTQHLARAIGLEAATSAIVSGKTFVASDFKDTCLFDQILGEEPLQEAIAFANSLPKQGPFPLLRDKNVNHSNAEGYLALVRANMVANPRKTPGHLPAIDCLAAAATKPYAEGMAFEYDTFRAVRADLRSKAFRYAFMAERSAAKVSGLSKDIAPRKLRGVAVIGAGLMGQGIAMACANAGLPVKLLDVNEDALSAASDKIKATYDQAVKRGKMTPDAAASTFDLIHPKLDYADIAVCDLVIEAVIEKMDVKLAVFKKLDEVMKPSAILASNTSTLDLNEIARNISRPKDLVGLHFFNPAQVMKLLEIVRGAATSDEVLATALAFSKRLRKVAVVAGVCDGFIGNRMVEQYLRQAQFLVEEGATPTQVDSALERWGLAMGPFRMMDLAGNDLNDAIRERRRSETPDLILPDIPDILKTNGWSGQKTGIGWYDYTPGAKRPAVNEGLTVALDDWRRMKAVPSRQISADEIVTRCVLALVNEGAALLAEGIAARASDIDTVYLTGFGFPVAKGGPMYAADQMGLRTALRRMSQFATLSHGDRDFWKPHPLLQRLSDDLSNLSDFGADL